MFEDYLKVSERVGIRRKRDETVFGQELHTLMPMLVDGPPGLRREKRTIIIDSVTGEKRRPPHYVLPTLDESRQAFDIFMKQPTEWPE
jgi:hypothetical protein